MGWLRRLSLSIGIAACAGATLTIAAVGAGGGFGLGPGTFTFTDQTAFVNTFNPADGSSIDINVDHSTFLFKARPNAPLQSGVMTVLNVTEFIPNPIDPTLPPAINSTCLVIPDSDFAVSADLQTATLNVVNESTLCPGFLVPETGAVIDAGGGGGGGGGGAGTIPLPLSASVTWTGNGAVGVSDDTGTFRCLTFVAATRLHGQQGLSASVTGSLTDGAGSVSSFSGGQPANVFGSVALNTSVQTVAGQGIIPPACGGKGG